MAFRFPGPLYPIADPAAVPRWSPAGFVEPLLAAGVRFLQLRVKGETTHTFVEIARAVKVLTDRYNAKLIINDRVDIARLIDAAGVHLGQQDLPPAAARQLLAGNGIIGLSTHNITQVEAALHAGGIDYLAFGPVFATQNKANPDPVQGLDELGRVRRLCRLPLVAIGGITASTLGEVLARGPDAVAVIGAIAHAVDPGAATRDLLRAADEAIARRDRHRS